MIEPVSIALLAHPYSFFLKFFVEASAAALITYGLVWVVMRPKDGRRVPSPFLWHLFGTMTALTCGAIFRTFAMLTFEGRGAYEPAAETGAAAFYTLFVPAVAAAVYLFFRLRHLSPTNHADPDQTNADFVDTSPNGGIPTMAREEMTRVGAADLKLASGPSEEFWSEANAELESTSRRPGLWARVFSESKGNESLAKANYLRHRALELQQQQDAQLEQARRDVEEATRVDAIAPQAAKEHADAAVLKGICPNCNAVVPLGVKRCPKCPAVFGPHSAWALHPVIASMEANGEPIGRVAPVPDAVPPWASTFLLVMAGVVVFGIVTAVVPAYQDYIAHFSDRGRLFQSDRGRRFNAIVDARRCAQARGLM